MAYKFQIGRTRLSGSTLFENGLQISGSGEVQEDLNVVKAGGLQLQGVSVTSTAAELNVLDELAQGSILIGDGSGPAAITDIKTSGQILVGNGTTAASVAVSGDASLASSGALTIADDAVTNAKLANITRGSIKVGGESNAPTDLVAKDAGKILVGDGTDLASVAVSGDATLASSGAVTLASAQANVQSLLNASLVVGRDADNDIDFATDNQIKFRAQGADQVVLKDGVLEPVTDSDVDLGTTAKRFKDAFMDSATVTGLVSGQSLSASAGLSGSSLTVGAATVVSPQRGGIFTQLDVDNLRLNGNVISSTDTDGNITLTPDGTGEVVIAAGNLNYAGTAVTATGAELNLLDTATAGQIVAGKAAIFSAAGQLSASALSSSGVIAAAGEVQVGGNLDVKGSVVNFSGVGTAGLDTADFFVSLDSATRDMQLRTRTNVVSDMAGTVTTTALKSVQGVLGLDIDNLGAEVIATGDTIVFNDDTDNGLHKETVDDLFKIGPALVDAAVLDTQSDHILFLDGGASGEAKKESMADLMASQAGTGVSVVGGKFTVDTSGGDRISVAAIADGGTAVAGINAFADLTADAAVSLPAAPTAGDVVIIKLANIQPGVEVTVNRQGSHVIDGAASQILESPFTALSCVYVSGSSGNDWRII
tara:strand:+ start:937 stop:2889 length:1953 start_codon:yes stop_codon:yes gene_type:complete